MNKKLMLIESKMNDLMINNLNDYAQTKPEWQKLFEDALIEYNKNQTDDENKVWTTIIARSIVSVDSQNKVYNFIQKYLNEAFDNSLPFLNRQRIASLCLAMIQRQSLETLNKLYTELSPLFENQKVVPEALASCIREIKYRNLKFL